VCGVWCSSFAIIVFVCRESGVFAIIAFFFGSVVVSRWNLLRFYRKCCFLNGFWCVFVVLIFLVWSLLFSRRNYCFFCRESGVFAIIDFFWLTGGFSLESVAFLPGVLFVERALVCFLL